MPFLAPFVPAIIGGASSILGGLFGGKKAQSAVSSQAPIESAAEQALAGSATRTSQAGAGFLNASPGTFTSGTNALNTSKGFWQSILQGGPSATAILGPEIGRTNATYDNALSALRSTAPRSGITTQTASDLPFQKVAATTSLYQQLLGKAPTELSNTGSTLANLGLGVGQLGNQSMQLTNQSNQAIMDYEMKKRLAAILAGTGAGKGIGSTLAQILFSPGVQKGIGGLFGGSKSTGSDATD